MTLPGVPPGCVRDCPHNQPCGDDRVRRIRLRLATTFGTVVPDERTNAIVALGFTPLMGTGRPKLTVTNAAGSLADDGADRNRRARRRRNRDAQECIGQRRRRRRLRQADDVGTAAPSATSIPTRVSTLTTAGRRGLGDDVANREWSG